MEPSGGPPYRHRPLSGLATPFGYGPPRPCQVQLAGWRWMRGRGVVAAIATATPGCPARSAASACRRRVAPSGRAPIWPHRVRMCRRRSPRTTRPSLLLREAGSQVPGRESLERKPARACGGAVCALAHSSVRAEWLPGELRRDPVRRARGAWVRYVPLRVSGGESAWVRSPGEAHGRQHRSQSLISCGRRGRNRVPCRAVSCYAFPFPSVPSPPRVRWSDRRCAP